MMRRLLAILVLVLLLGGAGFLWWGDVAAQPADTRPPVSTRPDVETRRGVDTRPPVGSGSIRTAASCQRADVQSKIDESQDGDTVIIPNGSCAWSSTVTISGKGIHLKGATAGSAIITNNVGSGELDAALTINEDTTHRVEVSQLRFEAGTGTGFHLKGLWVSGGLAMLIHHNEFNGNVDGIHWESNRGVIWSNTFTLTPPASGSPIPTANAIRCKPTGLTSSWTTASTMGTADTTGESNLYFETNTVNHHWTETWDMDDNCRSVIRYNTFNNSAGAVHGQDGSAHGVRHTEIYNNTFNRNITDDGCQASEAPNMDYIWFIRGGTGVIADNVIPDISTCAYPGKDEIKMTVMNLRRNLGIYPCWNQGYPAPHQVGWGYTSGGTQAGSSGIFQDSEPIYIWGNTGSGNYGSPAVLDFSPNECGGSAHSSSTYIQSGRDYILGTAKPGYTKYTYPHPLTVGH